MQYVEKKYLSTPLRILERPAEDSKENFLF